MRAQGLRAVCGRRGTLVSLVCGGRKKRVSKPVGSAPKSTSPPHPRFQAYCQWQPPGAQPSKRRTNPFLKGCTPCSRGVGATSYRRRRILNSGPVDLESLELAYPPRTSPEFVLKNGWCPPPESKPDLPFQVRASSRRAPNTQTGPLGGTCCRRFV